MTSNKSNGIGSISFNYRRYGTDSQVTWKVEYSLNNGSSWTQIGSNFTAPDNDNIQVFNEIVNARGDVRLRIRYASGTTGVDKRLNIDDIVITDFIPITPTIFTSGTLISIPTTYGTASSNTTFYVDGMNMDSGISINPPAGFQVSTTSDFSANVGSNGNPITIGANGTIASTPIYVRIPATTNTGTYSGNIALTGTNATTVTIATAASSVYPNNNVVIANWDFSGATNAIAANPLSYNSNVTVSTLSRGNNNGLYTTQFTAVTASSGYTGASGGKNAEAACVDGEINNVANVSTYFEFTITPNSGFELFINNVSFGSRELSTGPKNYSLRSSADNYLSDISSGSLSNNNTWILRNNNSLISISINNGQSRTFRIYGYNGTGSGANIVNWKIDDLIIRGIVSLKSPIASNQTLCSGATVSDLVATGQDLKWYNVAEGGTALNLTTVVTTGTYYVSQTVSSVESARTAVEVTITPNVGSIGSISGITNLASDATTATYSIASVSGATSYVWNLPAGMTLEEQTGASITVSISSTFTSGVIRVKAVNLCGETNQRILTVRKTSSIPVGGFALAISGNATLCSSATQTYTATEVGGGTYVWTVPSTVTIVSGQGTSSITVTATTSFTSGQLRVTCTTSSASQQATVNVSGATLPSAITGPVSLCDLTTADYSVASAPGVTYQWTVPSGMTILSGDNSSSISVSISGPVVGTVSVRSITTCGMSAPRTLSVGTTPVLGSISGTSIVCGAAQTTIGSDGTILGSIPTNQYTYSIAAIPGVTDYQWTAPIHASVISGQGTTSVVIEYYLSFFESG
ncbi:MAG: hypothetical protein ACOVOV_13975, partial [Dolichospermum sp.]